MKKIYLSLLTVLTGLSLQAQLTQANHAPVAGHTYQMYHCDSVSTSPGASGANANWNFASITTFTNLVNSYLSANSSNASYPSATIAVGSSASNTSYYSSTATNLNYYGGSISAGTITATFVYTTAAVVAVYPMSLNTTTNTVIGGNINTVVSGIPGAGTFTGNCNVKIDGSGTLTLPGTNATFTNVLRVVTSKTLDVAISSPISTTATLTMVDYDYYSVGTRNPLFSITTTTANIPLAGAPNTQTTVTRDKNANSTTTVTPPTGTFVSVAEAASSVISLNVYPNPSSSYVQFTTDSPDAKMVSIYDITGKLVNRETFVDGKIKLDVSTLNTGLYIYSVSGSNNRTLKTGKVTVNH